MKLPYLYCLLCSDTAVPCCGHPRSQSRVWRGRQLLGLSVVHGDADAQCSRRR